MSTGSPKHKPNPRLMRILGTTNPIRDIGKEDLIFRQWWARILRGIARLAGESTDPLAGESTERSASESTKRSPACSPANAKPLTVTQQFYLRTQMDRLDRCGFYQQPRRRGAEVDPLDQLLGVAEEEPKEPGEPGEPRED